MSWTPEANDPVYADSFYTLIHANEGTYIDNNMVASDGGSYVLNVTSGDFFINGATYSYGGGNINLTSYMPATSSYYKLVIVVISSTGTLSVIDGSQVSSTDAMRVGNLTGVIGCMLARIQLEEGETAMVLSDGCRVEKNTYTPSQGGTGLIAIGTSNQVLRTNTGATALEWRSLVKGDVGLGNVNNVSDADQNTVASGTGTGVSTGTWEADVITDTYIASSTTWTDKQGALTFGIANTNSVVVDHSTTAAEDDYAKFTTSGIEGRSYAEVKIDLSLSNVENTALSTWTGTSSLITAGVLVATSYGGILNTNIVSKIASETITGAWHFDGSTTEFDTVQPNQSNTWSNGTVSRYWDAVYSDNVYAIGGFRNLNDADQKILWSGSTCTLYISQTLSHNYLSMTSAGTSNSYPSLAPAGSGDNRGYCGTSANTWYYGYFANTSTHTPTYLSSSMGRSEGNIHIEVHSHLGTLRSQIYRQKLKILDLESRLQSLEAV